MTTITTRAGKGTPLTNNEVDSNFTNLNTDKVEKSGDSMTGNLSFGDNDRAIFGAGSDLEIYHSGQHSFIGDVGTGNLYIEGTNLELRATDNSRYLVGTDGGATKLYWAGTNAPKLSTTSTGIDVTGTVTADGLSVSGNAASDSVYTGASSSGTGGTFRAIQDDGAALASGDRFGNYLFGGTYDASNVSYSVGISALATEGWSATNRGASLRIDTTPNGSTARLSRLLVANNGDISFYEDTGTTAKFFWDASAESLGIGTSSPAAKLDVGGALLAPAEVRISNVGGTWTADDEIGRYSFYTTDGSGIGARELASIRGVSENGGTTASGALAFYTSPYNTNVSERMRISSAGNVGIGTSSPNRVLDVRSSQQIAATFHSTGANAAISLKASGTADDDNNQIAVTANDMWFRTNGSEKMRIDSSGNLLVGTTSTAIYGSASSASAGDVVIGNSTYAAIQANNDGQQVAILNRTGTDGGIAQFRKDGTTVGSIGVDNIDNIYLSGDAGHSGLMCGTDGILPYANGTVTDNSEDLGQGNYRWRDLYLSGGVYLGGTGAANHLDDYETGTFTVTNNGDATGAISIELGEYTKIGRTVTVRMAFTVTSNFSNYKVGGLPFAPSGGNSPTSLSCTGVVATGSSLNAPIVASTFVGNTFVYFYSTGSTAAGHTPNTTNQTYRFSFTYQIA